MDTQPRDSPPTRAKGRKVKEWKAERYPQIIEMAGHFGIAPYYAAQMRIRYLSIQICRNNAKVLAISSEYTNQVTAAYFDLIADATADKNYKLKREIEAIKYAMSGKTRTGEITPDMVARAKNYPIAELIDFDRTGSAIAFCHPDQKPSLRMMKGKNAAYCFPCARKFDPIDILRDRDGLSFQDAVRRLS